MLWVVAAGGFYEASAPWDEEPLWTPEAAPTADTAPEAVKSHPGYVYIGDEEEELTEDLQETTTDSDDTESDDTHEGANDHEDILLRELAAKGVTLSKLVAGTTRGICPECDGGSTREKSFVLTVRVDYLVGNS